MIEQYQIREMSISHVSQVVEIDRRSYACPWSREDVIRHKRSPHIGSLLICDPRDVVGFCVYEWRGQEIMIHRLAVRTDARRSGVGSMMVDKIKTKLVVQSRTWLRCVVDLDADVALAFLQSQDFLSTKMLIECPGDAVEMSWAQDPMDCEFAGSVPAAEYRYKIGVK